MITIYHHPHCSKSGAALVLVEAHARAHGLALEVVEYLKTPPSRERLQQLQALLGVSAAQMARTGEEEYGTLQLGAADDERLLDALAAHPNLLQRPIVVLAGRALIARPPELLQAFLRGDGAPPSR